MAIKYHPKVGQILMCDFHGFKEPEMIKKRPVVIVSPMMKERNGLATVVPLSTAVPRKVMPYHYLLPTSSRPKTKFFQGKDSWVKGDMINTVCFDRLYLIQMPRDRASLKRKYYLEKLDKEVMEEIQLCVIHGLGMNKFII